MKHWPIDDEFLPVAFLTGALRFLPDFGASFSSSSSSPSASSSSSLSTSDGERAFFARTPATAVDRGRGGGGGASPIGPPGCCVQSGQNHSPSGTAARGGSRQPGWYGASHYFHNKYNHERCGEDVALNTQKEVQRNGGRDRMESAPCRTRADHRCLCGIRGRPRALPDQQGAGAGRRACRSASRGSTSYFAPRRC